MVLVIDPQVAGISGDMMLCALVDLGADPKKMTDGILASVSLLKGGARIDSVSFERTRRRSVSALSLHLEAGSSKDAMDLSTPDTRRGVNAVNRTHGHGPSGAVACKGTDIMHAIRLSSERLGLSDVACQYASGCVDALIRSESRVHGVSADSVEFHEAADADTIVDVIGSAIALDDLGVLDERIYCLPVCVGGGTVSFSHGVMSNPAGAVLEILREGALPMRGSFAGCELTTPTGACMLAALHPEPVGFYPYMRADSVGYGAGAADHDGFANVLKVVRGTVPHTHGRPYYATDRTATSTSTGSMQETGGYTVERICTLETNVDDVSGEILGGLVERIMAAGAKDVTICPAITKKNRPSHLISVICDGHLSGYIAGILMEETGTLGVRISDSERLVAPRLQHEVLVEVEGRKFNVSYKSRGLAGVGPASDSELGRGPDDSKTVANPSICFTRFKIEYDDVKRISNALGMPARDAELVLCEKIKKIMENNSTVIRADGAGAPDSRCSAAYDVGQSSKSTLHHNDGNNDDHTCNCNEYDNGNDCENGNNSTTGSHYGAGRGVRGASATTMRRDDH